MTKLEYIQQNMQQTKKETKITVKEIQNNTKQTKYMKGHRKTTKRYEYGDNTHTTQRLQAYHLS